MNAIANTQMMMAAAIRELVGAKHSREVRRGHVKQPITKDNLEYWRQITGRGTE